MTDASPQQQVTQLLCDWRSGDGEALEKLIPLIQPELQRLAHRYMSRERAGHTLQTTALAAVAKALMSAVTFPSGTLKVAELSSGASRERENAAQREEKDGTLFHFALTESV